MNNRGLYIWVEGEDDERFFKVILKSKLSKDRNFIDIGG